MNWSPRYPAGSQHKRAHGKVADVLANLYYRGEALPDPPSLDCAFPLSFLVALVVPVTAEQW